VGFGLLKRRIIPGYVAFVMLLVLMVPELFYVGRVHALVDGQVSSRSIQMGDDTTNTSGGTTSYLVTFTPHTTQTIYGIIVDFCSTDPIPGDVCTLPTGFSVTSAATPISGVTGSWTGAAPNSGRTFEYTYATGTSLSSSTPVSFSINAVTNPTSVGTFYARIFTFNANSGAGSASTWLTTANGSDNTTDYDYGGIALSTAQTIVITSKVQEQITFCVYVTACGTQASINLGDAHDVLSTSAPSVDNSSTYSIVTNASHGAVVYLKGATLTSGSNTIPAAGSTPFLYGTPSTNIDFFGVCNFNTSGEVPTVATDYIGTSNGGACSGTVSDTGGTAVLTSLGTPYATFGFNSTNTTSTYGDLMATLASAGASVNQVVFAAGVNLTQPSGIYSTTLQLVATGTY